MRKFQFFVKRVFDIVLALGLIILLSPVFVLLYVLVYINLGSPVIFKQVRPGKNGKLFTMYKFRSMIDKRDSNGNLLEDKDRLNSFGMKLRATSLDELPQLVNILKGEMSFIGPRPLLVEYLPLYTERQKKRHDVLPGITGWSQINGRNDLSWDEKFELDIWYVENYSLWLDMKIFFVTLIKVLKREGISQEGHVTMEKFKGKENDIEFQSQT